jgi:hypothetical protein
MQAHWRRGHTEATASQGVCIGQISAGLEKDKGVVRQKHHCSGGLLERTLAVIVPYGRNIRFARGGGDVLRSLERKT